MTLTILKDFQNIIKRKIQKTGHVDWVSYAFNNSKEFNIHRQIVLDEMKKLNIEKITEYVYVFMNSIEIPPHCPFCDKKKWFGKYGKGYGKTCGSKPCKSKNMANKQLGRPKTEQERKNISKALKGIAKTEVTKNNISKARLKSDKRFWTDVTKEKMSKTMKNKFINDEKFKKTLLKNLSKGTVAALSEETKKKRINTFIEKYGVNNPGRLAKLLAYSPISQKLFDSIRHYLKDDNCFYAEHGGEKIIYYNNTSYRPDFMYHNIIIEFNGDIYHANPKLFSKDECPNPHHKTKTSEQIWENDERRIKYFESLGYKVIVVWEHDYRKNPEIILENIKKELINVQKN